MKAWEIHDGELGLREVEPPRPQRGDVLVRVNHSGLCGSDLPKLLRPADFTLPPSWRPGHEIIGSDPADRVVAVDPLIPCRDCAHCTAGGSHLCPGLRRLGWELPGGLAEHVAVPTTNVHPLPDGLTALHAVLADPAAVAIHGLRCNPTGPPGRLAIIGAGTIGLLTALYAHQQGWDVMVIHRDGRMPHETVVQAVPGRFHAPSTLPRRETFDVVVDAAAGTDPAPLEMALRLVHDGGTVIVQNAYHPEVHLPTPLRDLFRRSIHLIGSFSYCRRHRPDDFALALKLLRDHTAPVANLVTVAGELADLHSILGDRSTRSVRQALAVHPL